MSERVSVDVAHRVSEDVRSRIDETEYQRTASEAHPEVHLELSEPK